MQFLNRVKVIGNDNIMLAQNNEILEDCLFQTHTRIKLNLMQKNYENSSD